MIVKLEQFLHEKYTKKVYKNSVKEKFYTSLNQNQNCIDPLHFDDIVVYACKYIVHNAKLLMLTSNFLVFQMHILVYWREIIDQMY